MPAERRENAYFVCGLTPPERMSAPPVTESPLDPGMTPPWVVVVLAVMVFGHRAGGGDVDAAIGPAETFRHALCPRHPSSLQQCFKNMLMRPIILLHRTGSRIA